MHAPSHASPVYATRERSFPFAPVLVAVCLVGLALSAALLASSAVASTRPPVRSAQPQVAVGVAYSARRAPGRATVRSAAAAVSALKGPSGCVRASFAAGIGSAGVRSVKFLLDGRRLDALSSHRTHAKTLSVVWVDVSRLAPGAHRLVAVIVSRSGEGTRRLVTATRTLTFRQCAPAAPTPKSTG